MLNFGILGCGGIAGKFCKSLNNNPDVKIRAVAARDAGKAAEFAKKYNAERFCGYGELVRDGAVDIVYVATVHGFHYEHIKMCLENGKHVLSEKPMVLRGAHARECFELARKNNLFLMEGMWTRFNPCVRKAADWARKGMIGDVKLITANFCFNAPYNPNSRLYDPALGGGALYDVGVYVIEFATGIMGEKPVKVTGIPVINNDGVDTLCSLSMLFPSGAAASVNCAVNVKTPHNAAIYGSNGYILLNDFWKTNDTARYDNNDTLLESFNEDYSDGFGYEIRHVVGQIERGALESDIVPPSDTIMCADIFDMFRK